MSAADLRAVFQAAFAPKAHRVTIEGLGDIYLRPFSAGDVTAMAAAKDDPNRAGMTLARCLCDEAGELLFDPANPDHTAQLMAMDFRIVSRINEAANQISGLGAQASDEAKNA
jgi:hypothetical protein